MSKLHLTEGSERPPLTEGKLRLYSMEFCPYAQRVRLVLKVKNVPCDIVNVNLTKKPEWLFNIHPEGKVPALDTGSKIIVESIDIANFLDDSYPEPPLYPAEPGAKEQDKELIAKIGPLTGIYYRLAQEIEKKTPEQWLQEFSPHLQIFEDELRDRGTPFFGGKKPGMIDYMLWPWAERAGTLSIVLKERLPLKDGDFCLLRAWRKEMRAEPPVDETYHGPEKFHKLVYCKKEGLEPDYDHI